MYKSAFCGRIDEIPGISVDNFERADVVMARAYFLSHCHSDHTQGLYSDTLIAALERTGASLYMSEPTAAIIEDETTNIAIMKYIRPLKPGTSTVTLPRDPHRNLEELYMTVTLIPAGHSFGSVMFLFRTSTKTILFTGDFRMCPDDLPRYTHFHKDNGIDPITIDAMYVDTTFLNHRYSHFPKRSESIEPMIAEIRKWLEGKNNAVALHTSAKYGYEFVYNEIYKKLGVKVHVNEVRWKLYSKLSHLVEGVTNEPSRIHICRNMSEKRDHDNCITTEQGHTNFLYIHFSAMKWDNYEIDDNTINKISNNRIDVCFATHCSKNELLFFVNYFLSNKIVGFPNEYPEPERKTLDVKVSAKKRKMAADDKVARKEKITDKKVDRELLMKIFEF